MPPPRWEDRNHTWVQTLPCQAVEPCIGPVIDGVPSDDVWAPDGAHFCSVESGDQNGVINGCPIYSSARYANAMVEPPLAARLAGSSPPPASPTPKNHSLRVMRW
jgi:hypothetical protein